jgi:hypothetical protein
MPEIANKLGETSSHSASTPRAFAQESTLATLFTGHLLNFCIKLFQVVPGHDRFRISRRYRFAILAR